MDAKEYLEQRWPIIGVREYPFSPKHVIDLMEGYAATKPCNPGTAVWILAVYDAVYDDDLIQAQFLLSKEGSEDNKKWWEDLERIANIKG